MLVWVIDRTFWRMLVMTRKVWERWWGRMLFLECFQPKKLKSCPAWEARWFWSITALVNKRRGGGSICREGGQTLLLLSAVLPNLSMLMLCLLQCQHCTHEGCSTAFSIKSDNTSGWVGRSKLTPSFSRPVREEDGFHKNQYVGESQICALLRASPWFPLNQPLHFCVAFQVPSEH